MRALRSRIPLTCLVALVALPAFAHRPYERVAGTFERDDGKVLSIVRYRVDRIFFADPVSVRFRLADGTDVARTPLVFLVFEPVSPLVLGAGAYILALVYGSARKRARPATVG